MEQFRPRPEPEHKPKSPQAGAGPLGKPPPAEQTQPQQARAEGEQSLQGQTTFDDREPEAYKLDPTIFKSRTIEGMKALYNMIQTGLKEEELLKKGGNYRSGYITGLLDAERLLANYIEDSPTSIGIREFKLVLFPRMAKKETPESDLGKDSDVKK
jgi:hypothetical protein